MNRHAMFVTLCLLMGSASAQSGSDVQPEPGVLSLKGVTLGMPLEEAKTILGNHTCTEEKPGIVFCFNPDATVNGMNAEELLFGMDGKVILLQYVKMKFPESEAIRDILVGKFGEPTRVIRGTAYNGLFKTTETVETYWGSRRGDELYYSPWGASVVEAHSLAKLRLVDHTLYDVQWKQRRAGVYSKSNAKSDL